MNLSRFKSLLHSLVLFVVLASLMGSSLGVTPALAVESSGLPLGQLLNQNGTLNLTTGYNGKLDIDSYSISLDPQHGPLFRPLSIAGTWSALGATPFNNTVDDIVVNGTDVYAAGSFTDAGGDANADYIARFDGTSWSALGTTSLNDFVEAIAISGTDVYVGGSFTDAGGDANADFIAKFDGTSWSALGTTPLNGPVTSIGIIGTDVYAGGSFDNAGGNANADRIAKFNGTSWSSLGATPLNSSVRAIAVSGTDVYAGGLFTDAGGDANADYIARFDGTSWSALGATPLSNLVNVITISGTDVYAGGNFADAGGDANADKFAKFDGTSWSSLGATPFSSIVYAIAVSGTDVYVGGSFVNLGGNINSDYIARFNGTSWSPLGATPLSANVTAIAILSGTQVYAGGGFTGAGGDANADYIAKFTVSPAKAITAFSFASPAATGVVTEASHTIAITVPYATNVTSLVPTITHTGASISPNSGVAQDFTNPVVYTVTAADSSTQTYTVTVTVAANAPPVIAESDPVSVTMSEDGSPTPFALTLNANDANGHTLTWSILTPASHGTASASGTGTSKAIGYTPQSNYNGPDSFNVRVSDGNSGFDTITVNITIQPINDLPIITEGASISATISEDGSPTPFALTLNVSDIDSSTLTWSISTPASHGTASASGTGTSKAIGYTPLSDYNGPDSFVVQVSDGNGGTDTITVNVTIQPMNDAPLITEGASTSITMSEDGSPTAFALTLNVSDIDDDTITWSINSPASHGTASASGTGTSKAIGYTPLSSYNGPDSFVVLVSDGNGGTDTITVTVTIQPMNDTPVITESDPVSVTMSEDSSPTVFALTLNASDIDDDTLTWSINSAATYGTASASGTGKTKAISYTPLPDYTGPDSFIVQISDGNGGTDTVTINVTIQPVVDTPVITEGASISVTMSEDGSPTAFSLTLNASDPDGDTLTWSIYSPASSGTASAAPGPSNSSAISYSPLPNYTGADSFIVQVSDGVLTDSITVNITITPETDSPSVIWNQSYSIQYDTWLGTEEASAFAFASGYRKARSGPFTFKPPAAFTSFTWVSYRGPDQGKARVYVDGVLKKTVDLYRATAQWQYNVQITGLSNTKHTVVIKPLNTKNPASSNRWVVVDGFKVKTKTYDDDYIGISGLHSYGSWLGLRDPGSRFEAYRLSAVQNASMKFTFDGVQFNWVTARGPAYGKAQIWVDGVLKRTVDLYRAGQQWQYEVAITGLTYGSHTVEIKVLGTKNPRSTGFGIVSDGFEIE